MNRRSDRVLWSLVLLLFFFVASCSLQTVKRPEGEKGFFEETCRLERLAREHPKAPVRAESHLQLAFLYVNHRNPQLSYSRALQEMENYFSLTKGKETREDVQDWLAVLREVGKLQANIERLQKANKGLREEVADLKEKIERLKSLDRQIEERRRLTK